jgi:hypothetical protein
MDTKEGAPDKAARDDIRQTLRQAMNARRAGLTAEQIRVLEEQNRKAYREGELLAWRKFGYDQMIALLENAFEDAVRQGELEAIKRAVTERVLDEMSPHAAAHHIGFTPGSALDDDSTGSALPDPPSPAPEP